MEHTESMSETEISEKDKSEVQVNIQLYEQCKSLDISYKRFKKDIADTYSTISKVLNNDALSLDNIVHTVTMLMMHMETHKDLAGLEKKELLLMGIKLFIETTMSESSQRDELLKICEFVLPVVIDTIISLDKKEIVIGMKKAKNCFLKTCKK